MKIVVVSDSHGNAIGINQIFQQVEFDYLIYLGDGIDDLGTFINLDNVIAVSGNCDYFSSLDNEMDFTLGGIKFFITHGNKYGVKYSLNSLATRARELGVKYCLYGHTHRQIVEYQNDICFINPGTFQKRREEGLILNINGDDIQILSLKLN